MILREEKYIWDVVGYEEAVVEVIGEHGEVSEETIMVPIYDWALDSIEDYIAREEILAYCGITDDELDEMTPSELIAAAQAVAENKSSGSGPEESQAEGDVKYEIQIIANGDLRFVLLNFIGISEENTDAIMELYESRYMAYLYFDEFYGFIGEYELPPVVVGNITREQLLRVAVSIIGHPYSWGGKSNHGGSPVGPLDCSGYVDWVYYQCFGTGINGGGTAAQFYGSIAITEDELRPGDLGFYRHPSEVTGNLTNHVGIYIGKINGRSAFIHCGGSSFGTVDRPKGRVGISINASGMQNAYNPVTGSYFDPAMPSTNFKYFRRPNFVFIGDGTE